MTGSKGMTWEKARLLRLLLVDSPLFVMGPDYPCMNITPFDVLCVVFIFILHIAPSFSITAGHNGTGSSRAILHILFTKNSDNITLCYCL